MTVYFSLISPLAGHEREAVHERAHGPYADHQWLWRWFPAPDGSARDFLFRRHEVDGLTRFYVVSQREPQALGGTWQVQTRDYEPWLEPGSRWQFELRANPVVRHERDGKSKRHDVVMNAKKILLAERGLQHWNEWKGEGKPSMRDLAQNACEKWLCQRASGAGFDVAVEDLSVEAYVQHKVKGGDRDLQFSTVDLAGQLTVTDPQAFQRTLLNGLGAGKAFGCGLLLVKPVRD
ncbi:type I-E CRISPR-associated protein Cas6/Cse3/CasE [Curvibacter sp. RS43]|uniref:type I-E CRISPR-associated protein Cas6/Cse3/CasE n=1 Tax=Curvibacter microcysteis TaxID=3026419 RepID=UPI0023610BD4|nr:type I-E CRISPR-associated protein Cas6/Cse3/CasE [Curvibacter sp. RS43]MDD0811737.1 type I-E CRISPR-associated protein Cas6/Cse3/CasE [Curvibacter sp. RS43]